VALKYALGHVSTWVSPVSPGSRGCGGVIQCGSALILSAQCRYDRQGCVAHTDITERKRAEMAVRHSEQRFPLPGAQRWDRIAVVDATGIIR